MVASASTLAALALLASPDLPTDDALRHQPDDEIADDVVGTTAAEDDQPNRDNRTIEHLSEDDGRADAPESSAAAAEARDTRVAVLAEIQAHPATVAELVKATGRSRTTIVGHLTALTTDGVITRDDDKRYRSVTRPTPSGPASTPTSRPETSKTPTSRNPPHDRSRRRPRHRPPTRRLRLARVPVRPG